MTNSKYECDLQSVQQLVKEEPMLVVPDRYIFVDQEPSSNLAESSPMPAIPVIDMGSLTAKETKEFEILKLHSACNEWGIFQLANHGVHSSVMEKLEHEIEEFFKLPLEEKMKYKLRPGDVEGYGKTLVDSVDQNVDWADRFYMTFNPIHVRKPHLFPELPSSLREILEVYFEETQNLAMNLLKFMGEALKMEKNELVEMFEDGLHSMRMTYYPPCPKPEQVMGIKPHSDATGLTILLQVNGVEGLQVKKDGVWIPVDILPSAFVVNVGDTMEILSNGIYKSIEHRVTVNTVKERISTAMFFNPKLQAEIGPVNSLINLKNPPLYKRVTMEEYLKDFFSRKLNGKSFLDAMKNDNGNLINTD